MRRRNVETETDITPPEAAAASEGRTTSDTANTNTDTVVLVQGVGARGCSLPSPSGINTWSTPAQALVVVAYFGVLAFGTAVGRGILQELFGIPGSKVSIGLGLFYAFVGVSHFLAPGDFENVVPLYGTWGIWYVPGSRSFHVFWTSVVEIVGGLGLVLGSFSSIASLVTTTTSSSGGGAWKQPVVSDCSFVLFFLTVGMTPANAFMMTHGAKLPIESDPLPLAFHGVRLIVQALLLASLYWLGEETFERVLFSVKVNFI